MVEWLPSVRPCNRRVAGIRQAPVPEVPTLAQEADRLPFVRSAGLQRTAVVPCLRHARRGRFGRHKSAFDDPRPVRGRAHFEGRRSRSPASSGPPRRGAGDGRHANCGPGPAEADPDPVEPTARGVRGPAARSARPAGILAMVGSTLLFVACWLAGLTATGALAAWRAVAWTLVLGEDHRGSGGVAIERATL